MKKTIFLLSFLLFAVVAVAQTPKMYYGDDSRTGQPFSKDPHVVKFNGRYLMYYTIAESVKPPKTGLGIGIAESHDLINWRKVGEITPAPDAEYERKGIAAPGALVRDGKVHLFYQTYGNGKKDAICHATSEDGINFKRNPTNPIFSPTGDWNCGRAIDAEVAFFKGCYYLYFATRDKDFKIQMQGVASAPASTNFNREDWTQECDESILKPELDWEKKCIEAASVIRRKGKLVMFYAGAYNNEPQQIGVAVSKDGVNWKRMSDTPFLANGKPGEWNARESGHPHIFQDEDGRTYLFFQGNNKKDQWYLSNLEVFWKGWKPYLKR
ncbi:MAG: family 43 glycosylhydrolase [Alistipes sp.]|nr:family 43 glycosylhydrolase [Alistipes sp.]